MLSVVLNGLVIRPSFKLEDKNTLGSEGSRVSLGKSVIYNHISSCKDCHSCNISNSYTSVQANTDVEAKMR